MTFLPSLGSLGRSSDLELLLEPGHGRLGLVHLGPHHLPVVALGVGQHLLGRGQVVAAPGGTRGRRRRSARAPCGGGTCRAAGADRRGRPGPRAGAGPTRTPLPGRPGGRARCPQGTGARPRHSAGTVTTSAGWRSAAASSRVTGWSSPGGTARTRRHAGPAVGQPGVGRAGHQVEVDAGRADDQHRLVVTVDAGGRRGRRAGAGRPGAAAAGPGPGGRRRPGRAGPRPRPAASARRPAWSAGWGGPPAAAPLAARRRPPRASASATGRSGRSRSWALRSWLPDTDLEVGPGAVVDDPGHLEPEHLAGQHTVLDDRVGPVGPQQIGEAGRAGRQRRGWEKGRRVGGQQVAAVHPPHRDGQGEGGGPPGQDAGRSSSSASTSRCSSAAPRRSVHASAPPSVRGRRRRRPGPTRWPGRRRARAAPPGKPAGCTAVVAPPPVTHQGGQLDLEERLAALGREAHPRVEGYFLAPGGRSGARSARPGRRCRPASACRCRRDGTRCTARCAATPWSSGW